MAFQDKWFGAIRGSALIYITGFECVIVVANMLSISPTLLEKIAFAGIGIFIVLFKVQARVEGVRGLWFVGACLTFYMFMNFFLTICSIGLPFLTTAYESQDTKQLAYEYEQSVSVYNKLLKNQTDADYTMRTYMKDLGGPIADAKKSKEELRDKLQSTRSKDSEIQTRSEQSFNGIRVFETAPRLAIRALSFKDGEDSIRPDTRIGIIIAFLFGIAAGLFIEWTMIATVRRSQVTVAKVVRQEEVPSGVSDSVDSVHDSAVGSSHISGGLNDKRIADVYWPEYSDFILKFEVGYQQLPELPQPEVQEVYDRLLRPYCGQEFRKGYKATVNRNRVFV